MSREKPFKICSLCDTVWSERKDLLEDREVVLVGYQADFEELEMGLLFFNHLKRGCGTTFSVHAGKFQDLYHGPVFKTQLPGSSQCEGFCLHRKELRDCAAPCECAYIRHVLQIIRGWPKQERNVPAR